MTEIKRRTEAARQRLRDLTERGNQADGGLRRLAQGLTEQPDSRLTCAACEETLAAYVDDEIAGLDVARTYPDVKHHLDLCETCASAYARLLQLAWEMERCPQPLLVPTPALDLGFLPRLTFQERMQQYIYGLSEELTSILAPLEMDVLRTISDTFFARVAAFGEQFRLREGVQVALQFGGEVTEALRILTTTYILTLQTVRLESTRKSPLEGIKGRMQETEWTDVLRQRAENLAREMGMSRQQARTFAQQYVKLVTSDPEMLTELTRQQSESQ